MGCVLPASGWVMAQERDAGPAIGFRLEQASASMLFLASHDVAFVVSRHPALKLHADIQRYFALWDDVSDRADLVSV